MVTGIRVATRLNSGIYTSEGTKWEEQDILLSPTRAHLDYALDVAEYRRLETEGMYGSVGRGETIVEFQTDGDSLPVDDDYIAYDNIINDGDLNHIVSQVLDLRGTVWDGNNHVYYSPWRCLRWLSDDQRTEEINHCLVTWPANDEYAPDVAAVNGWAILDSYWEVWGNEGWETEGAETVDDITDTLDAVAIDYDVLEMDYGADGSDVVIVVSNVVPKALIIAALRAKQQKRITKENGDV